MELTAVILAAGEAKRMRSRQPKVLHPLCGRPLIAYALRTARAVADRTVVVIGPNAAAVRAAADAGVTFVEQRERLGTGHALEQALAEVRPDNEQGEYYLTDVIGILAKAGGRIEAVVAGDPAEALGINDRKQLAAVAAILRRRILDRLMTDGVTIVDPASTYIEDTVTIGPDSVVYPQVVIEGVTTFGAECVVGSGSQISASRLGDHAFVGTNSSLVAPLTIGEGAYIGAGSTITKDVPPGALAVGRGHQVVKEGWAARKAKKHTGPED